MDAKKLEQASTLIYEFMVENITDLMTWDNTNTILIITQAAKNIECAISAIHKKESESEQEYGHEIW